MPDKKMFALLNELWKDAHTPEFYSIAVGLLLVLALSWWISSMLRKEGERRDKGNRTLLKMIGVGGIRRMTFPFIALILVFILRKALLALGWDGLSLLYLANALLVCWALVRILVYVLRCVFSQGGFLNSFERWISLALWSILALHITGLADLVVKALEQVEFAAGKQSLNLWMLLHGAVTVGITLLIALWIGGLIETWLMTAQRIDGNARVVVVRLAKAFLSVIALLLSLSLVGIDITALSVFSGALAVGLGLGLQKIASNYVSGFIILLDRSICLGNLITLDDKTTGLVTQITTRYTVLNLQAGTEVIIPNEYLVNNMVRNLSFTDKRLRATAAVQIAYDADLEKAMALLIEAATQQSRVLANPAPGVVITELAASGINLELGFWVADPELGTGGVRSEIYRTILRSFRENGIDIPYPTVQMLRKL